MKMLRVGLTGGIASGKSTVADLLRARDIPVLEMDPLGHELLEPGQAAYEETVREFGREILAPGGAVDRAKLGAIVFADATRRERLNGILHPRIIKVVEDWFAALDRPGKPPLAVVEAALIVEAGYHKSLDRLIVCWSQPGQQLARLQERGFTSEQAALRIAAQMPMDEKRKFADFALDCSGPFAETERQLDAALKILEGESAAR